MVIKVAFICLICSFLFATYGSTCSTSPFGEAGQYAIYSLDTLSFSDGYVSGAVAAQGNTFIDRVSVVGGKSSSVYSVASGESVSLADGFAVGVVSGVSVDTDNFLISYEGIKASRTCCGNPSCSGCVTGSAPLDFSSISSGLLDLDSTWNDYTTSGTVDSSFGNMVLKCNSDDFNVFSDVDLSGIYNLKIECSSSQTVLINYVDSVCSLSNMGVESESGAVIHRFTCSDVELDNVHVQGYIFAPNSVVTLGKLSISGGIYAGNVGTASESSSVTWRAFDGCALVKPSLPNFIIFLADDLGYADLSVYGAPDIRTPNIDRLANGGKRLSSFYSSPMCSPTRAAILTGRLPIRSGCYNNQTGAANALNTPVPVFYPPSFGMLPESEVLISNILSEQGYNNGLFGKWHLGTINETALPLQRGFHRYWGMPYSSDMGCPPGIGYPCVPSAGPAQTWTPVPLYSDNTIIEQPTTFGDFTTRLTSQAIDFINQSVKSKKPFFVNVNYVTPHVPLFTAPEFQGSSDRGPYGDTVQEIDFSVGRVMEALDAAGVTKNTLVVFTSDNGPAVVFGPGGGSTGPFSFGGKGTTWEGGVRVPSIWYWPEKIQPGTIDHNLTSVVDFLPTFANLAGASSSIPTDRAIDGVDLAPMLLDNAPVDRNCMVYYTQRFLAAARCGDFKLHYMTKQNMYGVPVVQDPPLLFNVRYDPREVFPLTDVTFPQYNNVVGQINAYKDAFLANLVPGVPQFELYNATAGAYQPCCDPSTDPPCFCPPEGLQQDLIRMAPQRELHESIMDQVMTEEQRQMIF